MKKSQPKRLEFSKALKSFMGYLEGTQKATHTIKNYRLDLQAFFHYLDRRYDKAPIACENLGETDLNAYGEHLSAQGQKTNTRRRKLLTAHRFVRYLSQRKLLLQPLPSKLPAPHKMERVPYVVPQDELIRAIRALPLEQPLDRRNRALLWVLAESACQVSEITQLKFEAFVQREGQKAELHVPGKSPRTLSISGDLFAEIQILERESGPTQKWLFLGFNKHGSLGGPISARGVELLVKTYSARLGLPKMTPRTFRHSAVLGWFQKGATQGEIQKWLGLKTSYAFRTYAPLLTQVDPNLSSNLNP